MAVRGDRQGAGVSQEMTWVAGRLAKRADFATDAVSQPSRLQHRGFPIGELMYSGANEKPVSRLHNASAQPADGRLPLPSGPRVVFDNGTGGTETRGDRSPADYYAFSDRNLVFLELLAAYRVSGGLARAHEMMASLRSRNGLTTEQLAQWIVACQTISFDWQELAAAHTCSMRFNNPDKSRCRA